MTQKGRPLAAVILAAGKGTRMKSDIPKVLHPLMGKPMVRYILDTCIKLKADRTILVIGHQADLVRETLGSECEYVEQTRQLGTGHALMTAAKCLKGFSGDVMVLAGDTPFLTPAILKKLLRKHHTEKAAATMMTALMDPPLSYGRIVRDDSGNIQRIVEERDATPAEKAITEVNTSHYIFRSETVLPMLSRLHTDNDQGEYYLTDIIAMLAAENETVASVTSDDPGVLMGINHRLHLAEAHQTMKTQILTEWMLKGVSVPDPGSVYVEPDVRLGEDVTLLPNTMILGKTVVGRGCTIGPQVKLQDARIGTDCRIEFSVIENRKIDNLSRIGPFAYIYHEEVE